MALLDRARALAGAPLVLFVATASSACTMANPNFQRSVAEGGSEDDGEELEEEEASADGEDMPADESDTDEGYCDPNFPYMYAIDFEVSGYPCLEELHTFGIEIDSPGDYNTPADGLVTVAECTIGCATCYPDQPIHVGAPYLSALVETLAEQEANFGETRCLTVYVPAPSWVDEQNEVCHYDAMFMAELFDGPVFLGRRDAIPLPAEAQTFLSDTLVEPPSLDDEPVAACDCAGYWSDYPGEAECCFDFGGEPEARMTAFAGDTYEPGAHILELPSPGGDLSWRFEVTKASHTWSCDTPQGEDSLSWALIRM
ncbi:hypothetical protein PPSIR1_15560 [Plesiocystis pacifica SIR-1]|uniref:Lipoprotein n=1 Tax=Plesiocystis pacifica SIR-1 TaxID=391625 RepID=A6GH80_9BACT|nr:hypothetical protein PPSIR1_15560 [Plesiocystis pacifica SIR-1]